jgi:hypothetical protein
MNRKTAIILLLITSVILVGVTEAFARPQYLTSLTEVYGDGSCETCHVINPGSGQRDFNGTFTQHNSSNGTFDRRNSNRTLQPNSNETPVRRNSNRTMGNRNSNRTLRNSYGTLFESQPEHANDTKAALMAIGQPPAATAAPDGSTLSATENKAAPGFDLVVFVFGLSAGILLSRRHDK